MKTQQQLLEALQEYRSQFGQALECNKIRFGPAQKQAEEKALLAIAAAEKEAAELPELVGLLSEAFEMLTDNDMMPPNHALKTWIERTSAVLSANNGRNTQ